MSSASCNSSAIADLGPTLGRDLLDCGRIQNSRPVRRIRGQCAPKHYRSGTPFLQRSIVQVRVRIRVQNLMTEHRRLGCVERNRTNRAGLDSAQDHFESFKIHRLIEAVRDRFVYERMIGNPNRPGQVFSTRNLIREHGGQQIVGPHPLDLGRNLRPSAETQDRECTSRIPPPARSEHRRIEQRLRQDITHGRRLQELEYKLERKGVTVAQRNHDSVVCCCGLQFEVEGAAEALAQRKAPRAIHT